jgi:putative intracellular protease/amidase
VTDAIRVSVCGGATLAAALPALAQLRLTVFRSWPYLYDGSEEYEAAYLRTYLEADGAAVVIAWDGETAVGASTCLPMAQADVAVRAAFVARGLDPAAYFYFGESACGFSTSARPRLAPIRASSSRHSAPCNARRTMDCVPQAPPGWRISGRIAATPRART